MYCPVHLLPCVNGVCPRCGLPGVAIPTTTTASSPSPAPPPSPPPAEPPAASSSPQEGAPAPLPGPPPQIAPPLAQGPGTGPAVPAIVPLEKALDEAMPLIRTGLGQIAEGGLLILRAVVSLASTGQPKP